MRIALVIERFEPQGGGAEAVAWRVAQGLAEAGDQVHVLAREAPPGAQPDALRIRVLRVPATWQPLRVALFSRAAAQAARELGVDLVHSFSRTLRQDVFRAGGGCHAAYMQRAYSPAGARWRRLSPRHAMLLGIEEAVLRDPHQIIQCNSAMVQREFTARYALAPERVVVIPNGVDLLRFAPGIHAAAATRLRERYAPGARRVWLLAGSGFRRKGLDTALRALDLSSDPDAMLWVAGGDDPRPWQARARAQGLAGRVSFLGPRRDLPRLYAAADALLLPTRYDAFANVCLEAAASALPVVTSDANGAAEWLGAGAMRVTDPENAEGFAAALDALRDPQRRALVGQEGRRRAEGASWDAHIAALRALYAKVAA